jgi:hypothetical protein
MAVTKKSLKNLKPFKKGKGKKRDPRINANGAPKKIPALKELMRQVLGHDGDDLTKSEMGKVVAALAETAKSKKSYLQVNAAKELLDRMFGKVKTEDDGGMGTDLNITVNIKK